MAPDFIIIGAGSAGCVLANRLSGPDGGSVLLLEAGGSSRGLAHQMPLAATSLWFDPVKSWSLMSEPEPGLNGRRITVPRGRALGGSSAINGTVYNRGSPHDYDGWRALGLMGWDYASVLPYFRRIENHWRDADEYHGRGGEVSISPNRNHSPFTEPFFEAARQMGLPLTKDMLGGESEGIGLSDLNVDKRGRRISAADAFLTPIRSRKNLTIKTGVQVLRIIVENGRAIGVEYLRDGNKEIVHGDQIVLSGGAIASPQLLLLSGIGPAEELKAIGIRLTHDLPEVGRNFNDQPGASFEFRAKQPFTFSRHLRIDRFITMAVQWGLGLGGPAAGPPIIGMGSLRTSQAGRSPDLQMLLSGATLDSKIWIPGLGKPSPHSLMISFALTHPESRGRITLANADTLTAPRIKFNLLKEPGDIEKMKGYYRMLIELIRQPALKDIAGEVTRPSPLPDNDAALEAYIRNDAWTTLHPMGSCRMGVDSGAVVDSEFKVSGIGNLRVIDASIFPTQVCGNPNAAVMMVGDRASDIILGRPALPPAFRDQAIS